MQRGVLGASLRTRRARRILDAPDLERIGHLVERERFALEVDLDIPGEGWTTADATFPDYKIGQAFPLTFATELAR